MKIGAAPAADLGILTAALDEPGPDVVHSLRQLGVDAQAAVPTYLGLSVTVDGSDPPFTFTTVEDGDTDDVRASLRLALPHVAVGSSTGTASELDWVPEGRVNSRHRDLAARSSKCQEPQKNTEYWFASMDRRLLTMP
jgi:hypothetical protein